MNNIWHPYTKMKDFEIDPPIFIERAEGLKLFDNQGNFYYDTISSWWCNIHGHNHPKIVAAINEQLTKLDHVLFAGFTHENAILLAEKLIEITPKHITKVFYSDNGSTAVEIALKMSLQYWNLTDKPKKTKFVALDRGYHGDTVGAMSVSSVGRFNDVFKPLLFESFKAKTPYRISDSEALESFDSILKNHHEEIAAFIVEPLLMGAGGMIMYSTAYLEKAAELCKKYEIHLIVDEVATGFGRTGKMFAIDHTKQNVKPDFMCISKGITSGTLPLAATLTTDDVYSVFEEHIFYHGHTYTANPIACAAAVAALQIFEDEDTLNKIQPRIEQLRVGLKNLKVPFRQLGMVVAIELPEGLSEKIYQLGLREHLILRPIGNVVYLYLPLCVKEEELAFILEKTVGIVESIL